MKIYNEVKLENNIKFIWLDGARYACKVGKHCIWIPGAGVKIPWMFNGKVQAYQGWHLGMNKVEIEKQVFNDDSDLYNEQSFNSIKEEYIIFKMLNNFKMCPEIGDIVYIKNMIAPWLQRSYHCDPIGCIGYQMKNAEKEKKGLFTWDRFVKLFLDTKYIELSRGAEGDIKKRDNIINGYLIDVRRTIWDMMHITEKGYEYIEKSWHIAKLNTIMQFKQSSFKDDKEKLKAKVLKYGQFPFKQRKTAYQEFILDGNYQDGTRKIKYRMDKMGINLDLEGKSVLSLGCQIGSICNECYMRGARHITGLDNVKEYIECARDIARYNHFQVNYMLADLSSVEETIDYINGYYKDRSIDIVFLLSMYKHIGVNGWRILEGIKFKVAYIESNNCPQKYESKQAKQIERELCLKFGCAKRLGITEDRSPRCLWKVSKK